MFRCAERDGVMCPSDVMCASRVKATLAEHITSLCGETAKHHDGEAITSLARKGKLHFTGISTKITCFPSGLLQRKIAAVPDSFRKPPRLPVGAIHESPVRDLSECARVQSDLRSGSAGRIVMRPCREPAKPLPPAATAGCLLFPAGYAILPQKGEGFSWRRRT